MSKLELAIAIPALMFLILLMICTLVLGGCVQRALVRDCQVLEGSPFLNCEVVQKL